MTEGAPKREVRFDPNEILLELFNEEGENVGKLIPYYDALSFFGLDDTDIELNGQTFEQRANKMLIAQDNLESKILPEYTGLLYQLFKYVIDGFANKIDLEKVINDFKTEDVDSLKKIYSSKENSSGWNFEDAKKSIESDVFYFEKIQYRPFDIRETIITKNR
jgi:hypothetical protein